MNINGKAFRTIWVKSDDEKVIQIIDQRYLPHQFVTEDLCTVDQMATAIKDMHLRGAGLIGAAAGFGIYLATLEAPKDNSFDQFILLAAEKLISTRPTAVNLVWAVNKQMEAIRNVHHISDKINIAFNTANEIADSDAEYCRSIGEHGYKIIEEISKNKNGATVNILTHCNAGWLAFVDYGSATSPIYAAHKKGINVHVWVDETRPRNQGSSLTAWEMEQQGVPYTIIADNTGGHLMQHDMVDLVIVGSDRTTHTGDVANKIGTYLKALAAKDNNIPFYAALPSSTIDWQMEDGIREIIIEERNGDEVKYISGLFEGEIKKVLLTPVNSKVANYGFDVTPARLITGIITERGVCDANKTSILNLFPEKK
ncbi:MAG: S-methyl-5-thioribose-1-phosphate isomerase [Bacteroidota bacterium]